MILKLCTEVYNYLIIVKYLIKLINYVIIEFKNSEKSSPSWTYKVTWRCEKWWVNYVSRSYNFQQKDGTNVKIKSTNIRIYGHVI